MTGSFSYEEHTADVAVRVLAPSFGELCVQAARACTNLLADVDKVKPVNQYDIELMAASPEKLLFAFLDHVIYLLDANHAIICDGVLTYDERAGVLRGTLRGDSITNYDHHGDIKAPTKHELRVSINAQGASAYFILDI